MQKHFILFLFLCLHGVARGQTSLNYRYWFDEDISTSCQGVSETNAWNMQVDASKLTYGIHYLNFQVTAADTLYSPVCSTAFIKTQQSEEPYTALCYINGSLWAKQQLPKSGSIINWNLDVSSLAEDNLHAFLMLIITPNGEVSSMKQTYFWRVKTKEELGMACYYSLDGGKTLHEAGLFQNQGFCFDVDIKSLDAGLHQLSCFLVDQQGYVTHSQSYYFIKPNEVNLHYDYWVNNDTKNMRSVAVKAIQPYHFIDVLEVDAQPINPNDFHFEVDQKEAYVYAKNMLHVRFNDGHGAYVSDSCIYIDGVSRQLVEPRAMLRPMFSYTDEVPSSNSIHWYTLPAATGDSLSFKLSQNATIELYSPTGVPLIKMAQGVEEGVGLTVSEDGTYYLAVHSVTGLAEKITIELNNSNLTQIKVLPTKKLVDVYTLDGVLLYRQIPVNNIMNELPRGIYIISGQKVLIK